jgi:Predicted membrane protein (DUF2127)
MFLPLEVHEVISHPSLLKIFALTVNIAAVIWLVSSKRLFGVRGGRHAYEQERSNSSLIALEQEKLEATEISA